MQGEESQRVEIGEGEMEWVWNGPDSTIVICDASNPNSLESEASQFLIGTKRQMEEQISNAEKIFVVRKNAIKMIIKRYSRRCRFYGVGDMY